MGSLSVCLSDSKGVTWPATAAASSLTATADALRCKIHTTKRPVKVRAPLPLGGLSHRKSPPSHSAGRRRRPRKGLRRALKRETFLSFFLSFLFSRPFLLSPTFFPRKGRCVTFPPPERNFCDDLSSFSSRSTCQICQPGLFVAALGSETTLAGSRRCCFSSNPARSRLFFPPPFIPADHFQRDSNLSPEALEPRRVVASDTWPLY